MPQFGGKPKKTSSDSKRHFTVVMGGKEHGLYVSSTPSSAARKAVTKLCTANKSKKVEFHIREITQGSKKKTYGPYEGYIEKLKEPIELKGRVIRYKPVAKLSGKTDQKKTSKIMKGGGVLYSVKVIAEQAVRDGIVKELKEILSPFSNSLLKQYKINLVNFMPDGKPSFIFSTKNQYIFNGVIRFIEDKIVRGVKLEWIQSPYDKNRDFTNIDNNSSI
jgi:hypothetical protein